MPTIQKQLLASWDATKQQTYRAHQQTVTLHVLLDASPSMAGQDAVNLRTAYNLYLAWLQRHADPMILVEVRCFSTTLQAGTLVPLGVLHPLTAQTYDPLTGDGTALYRAVGETCTTAPQQGQHLLIVFTDGRDNTSDTFGWTAAKVREVLTTLQDQEGWLGVFLGAFADAVPVGTSMGFTPANCLVFPSDQIPEAFRRLQQATQKYLTASPQERKLLTAGGLFA
jgi:hypothetical protein